ncbi:MAG: hypothetical protein KKH67_09610 [candidate division Zixibacteria bacterium]|nr:hypothetical protein [candidate division Zixibacteria bacterium]MBU1469831.1 hypothetical protein [candidate division Zixibacteria bacterium]
MFAICEARPRIFRVTALFVMLSFFWITIGADMALAQQEVTVPAGTVVSFTTSEVISPKVLHVGDRVNLRVTYDVIVDDIVVIKAGTKAVAEVTESTTSGAVGKPAKIGISIKRVEAVDGSTVPLYGTRLAEGESKVGTAVIVTILCCVLGLLIKGGTAELPAGTEIQTETAGTVKVTVE